MKKIPFKVSARTARLIGSENISSPEAALIELVKNSFDADAENCIVIFDNVWLRYLVEITAEEYDYLILNNEFDISEWYKSEFVIYRFKLTEADAQYQKAVDFFLNKCSIYVLDNGEGMTSGVIENQWMTIGTANKYYNYTTGKKERVKSGAKGIGRFALDKLGAQAQMFTTIENSGTTFLWKINWNDFDIGDHTLSDVTASLEELPNQSLSSIIKDDVVCASFERYFKNVSFNSGTLIKISHLRDTWTVPEIATIYNNLEVLIPPKEVQDFNIQLYSTLIPSKYGSVSSSFCDDYDYQLSVKFINPSNILCTIDRREFDIKKIPEDVFKEKTPKDMSKYPFDKATLSEGSYTEKYEIEDLWPGIKKDNEKKSIIKNLGAFEFIFYFMKLTNKGNDRFATKTFVEAKRKEWLNRFGGIKIFRDDFRVRPYGEKGSNSFDWLGLGERAAQSTFGPGQLAGINWRVGPNQVYGVINISRIANEGLKDISNRGGLVENESFDIFKQIIIKCINLVEKDRHYIIRPISVVIEKKAGTNEIKTKAIEQSTEDLRKIESKSKGQLEITSTHSSDGVKNFTYAKGIQKLNEDLIEKDNEIKILRGLASVGLTIATFSHELTEISNKLAYNINKLDQAITATVDRVEADKLSVKANPYHLIQNIKELTLRLENWLNFSNNSVKKDRRKASNVSLQEYFTDLEQAWLDMFNARSSKLKIRGNFDNIKLPKTFKIDLDSIFNNLLINSLEAFHQGRSTVREVSIDYEFEKDGILLLYQDTGPGLDPSIRNPYEIFEPFFTTKLQSIDNYKDGIGLGMWIMKATIDEYNGSIELINDPKGFNIHIFFPLVSKP
jgi:signal transduction histidine kinase